MGTACSSENAVADQFKGIPNFKIILIGDPEVGKSSVYLRYIKNQFDYSYKPTGKAALENVVRKLNLPENAVVSVTLWDLPGREDMDLRATYYKNVDAAIVVVDMSDLDSIELAGTWRQDFLNKVSCSRLVTETLPDGREVTHTEDVPLDPKSVPMLLLGNKYDLVEEKLREEESKHMLNEIDEKDDLKDIMDAVEDEEKERKEKDNKNEKSQGKDTEKHKEKDNKTEQKAANPDGDETEPKQNGEENPDEETNDKEFPAQRGPKEDEVKPECVTLLEQVAAEYGFVGSIIVSAKDADGSVHQAIQSLIRHLLLKNKMLKPRDKKREKEKETMTKQKTNKRDNSVQLLEVGLPQYDILFSRCNVPLQRVRDFCNYYDIALQKLKQLCGNAGIITEAKCSLEDCIVAVRDNVGKHKQLLIEENDNFVDLTVDYENEEEKLSSKMQKCLSSYDTEYAAVCKAILREFPHIDVLLDKLDTRIFEQGEQVWELVKNNEESEDKKNKKPDPAKIQKEVKRIIYACEQNRAHVTHSRTQLAEAIANVENDKKRIKAAMLW